MAGLSQLGDAGGMHLGRHGAVLESTFACVFAAPRLGLEKSWKLQVRGQAMRDGYAARETRRCASPRRKHMQTC